MGTTLLSVGTVFGRVKEKKNQKLQEEIREVLPLSNLPRYLRCNCGLGWGITPRILENGGDIWQVVTGRRTGNNTRGL